MIKTPRNQFPPLPVMHTFEDVLRMVKETSDSFYMTAFILECWLGQLTNYYVAEYSEKKQAKERQLQTGIGLRLFDETFQLNSPEEVQRIIECIARFAEYRDPQSQIVFRAFGCMNQDFPFPDLASMAALPAEERMERFTAHTREFFCRLCSWVEAIIHKSTHVHSWLSPVTFHPDMETREIASVGVLQRHIKTLTPEQKAYWQKHFYDLADAHSDKPKWLMLGKAMASEQTKEPHHPEVDLAVIRLWPVVIRHNWTYRELRDFLLEVLPTKQSYPCEREQDLAAYCANVLGLRKGGAKGRTKTREPLPGLDVARSLFAS